MPLDLLVPDLLLPRDAPAAMRELRLPALERWMARGEVQRGAADGAVACLASAYGLPLPAPVAAIELAAGEVQPGGAWLRADPVHLRVDRDALTLHDASILNVTPEEAAALVAALQALFAPDLAFHAEAPDRWYVRVAEAELPVTTPLERATGRNVFGLLPAGRGSFNWKSAITEAQMVLSAHEVNAKREAAGLPAINSVWFWGEGTGPAIARSPYSAVYADDPFCRGLARLSGATLRPLPRELASIDLGRAQDSILVLLGALTPPLRRVDGDAWRLAAEALDEHWFAGLGEAVGRFDRVRVVLPSESGSAIAVLDGAARRRWYRRRKPLAIHA
jgi:hypothetical protein